MGLWGLGLHKPMSLLRIGLVNIGDALSVVVVWSIQFMSQLAWCCYRRDNGTWCVSDGNECAWCATTQQCFAFVEYVPRYPFGGCRHWYDGVAGLNADGSSDNCSQWSDCRSCLQHFTCGWCSQRHNPTIGVCFHGDFAGIYTFALSTLCDVCVWCDVHYRAREVCEDISLELLMYLIFDVVVTVFSLILEVIEVSQW